MNAWESQAVKGDFLVEAGIRVWMGEENTERAIEWEDKKKHSGIFNGHGREVNLVRTCLKRDGRMLPEGGWTPPTRENFLSNQQAFDLSLSLIPQGRKDWVLRAVCPIDSDPVLNRNSRIIYSAIFLHSSLFRMTAYLIFLIRLCFFCKSLSPLKLHEINKNSHCPFGIPGQSRLACYHYWGINHLCYSINIAKKHSQLFWRMTILSLLIVYH